MHQSADRRRFPRVLAQVYYRPAGPAFLHHRRATHDVSAGGMRVRSDDFLDVGTPLEIELLMDDGSSARCWARVAWIDPAEKVSRTGYDIGLEFTDMADADRTRLNRVLETGQT